MARPVISRTTLAPGGGPFALEAVTLGIFLSDQPTHRIATGRDKADLVPMSTQAGWIMPAGAEGLCVFEAPLDLLTVRFDGALLREAGLEPASFRPSIGALDPLLVSMALGAEGWHGADPLYRDTMAQALTLHLARGLAPPPAVPAAPETDPRIARALDYLNENLAEPLSLAELAAVAALSEAQFTRAFRAVTGRSPLQYAIAARMERAATLLSSTRLSVAEIAHRVGYGDLSRFGQHFKRQHGATPGAFRKG